MAPIDYEKIQSVVYNIIVTSMMASMAFFVCFLSVHHDWLGFFSEGFSYWSGESQWALDVRKPAYVPLWAPYLTVLSSLSGRAASNYSAKQYILQSKFNFELVEDSIIFKALLFGFFGLFLMGYGVYYQIERYIGILLTFSCKNNPNTELYRLLQ